MYNLAARCRWYLILPGDEIRVQQSANFFSAASASVLVRHRRRSRAWVEVFPRFRMGNDLKHSLCSTTRTDCQRVDDDGGTGWIHGWHHTTAHRRNLEQKGWENRCYLRPPPRCFSTRRRRAKQRGWLCLQIFRGFVHFVGTILGRLVGWKTARPLGTTSIDAETQRLAVGDGWCGL